MAPVDLAPLVRVAGFLLGLVVVYLQAREVAVQMARVQITTRGIVPTQTAGKVASRFQFLGLYSTFHCSSLQ